MSELGHWNETQRFERRREEMRCHTQQTMMKKWIVFLGTAVWLWRVVQVVASSSNNKNIDEAKVKLRVSWRKEDLQNAPSCQHTFSQIELLNLHTTEAVVVHSIRTIPEITRVISNVVREVYMDLPQQLHVSRLPSNSLTLGPGQVAVVPVTFLPRFPALEEEDATVSPTLSSLQQLDQLDWLGSQTALQRRTRCNQDWTLNPQQVKFRVSTRILVDTNRGIVQAPLELTSIRLNEYDLPDRIDFLTSTTTTTTTQQQQQPLYNGITIVDRYSQTKTKNNNHKSLLSVEPSSTSGNQNRWMEDCYDVYMKNPGSSSPFLEIQDVLVSRPDALSLQVLPQRNSNLLYISPRQVIREWKANGASFTIPADGIRHYLVTICTCNGGVNNNKNKNHNVMDEAAESYLEEMEQWIDSGDPNKTLGFLQIRTETDTLFVGLERSENNNNNKKDNIKKDKMKLPSVFEAFETGNKMKNKNAKKKTVLMKAVPEVLDFHFLSSANPTRIASIAIQNVRSPKAIKLMRASVALNNNNNMDDDSDTMEENKKVGVQLKIRNVDDQSIARKKTLEDAIRLEVSVDWDNWEPSSSSTTVLNETITFKGSVVVRGTAQDWDYGEWEKAIISNSLVDSDLVLEIPFSVHIAQGKIGLILQETTHPFPYFYNLQKWNHDIKSVDAAFFPVSAYNVRSAVTDDEAAPFVKASPHLFDMKYMEHRLRAFSNVDAGVEIEDVVIEADEELVGNGTVKSLCESFEVGVTDKEEAGPFGMPTPGLTDLGLVHLRYAFPLAATDRVNSQNKRTAIFPTLCHLRLTTTPDTGSHLTPLVIYPGQVDVSASEFSSEFLADPSSAILGVEDENAIWHSAVVGFDKLTAWFQDTKAGSVLRSILDANLDSRKNPERDGILLGRYLYSLARQSIDLENSRLRPVLLKVGAIEQGEMETLPLYLTNHNPVPILLNVDVGEVEGMSISIGRDPSSGKGDGNSVIDHLPKKPHVRYLKDGTRIPEPRINRGPFAGHPVNGLRQFLMKDELAGSILSQFTYRQAVSLSDLAVSRLPLLKKLYAASGFAEFYKSSDAVRFLPDTSSRCNQSAHPPLYGPFEKKLTGRRMPGPVIVSNDGNTVRRLPVCWDKELMSGNHSSHGKEVVLPPGGVARFDINLRSPPSSVLDKDITEFLATGLVLSTNYREVIPIFVTFEALQGKLEVSHFLGEDTVQSESGHHGVIRVPMRLFGEPSPEEEAALKIPPRTSRSFADLTRGEIVPRNASLGENSVSLFMRSSFNRDLRLRKISSCNPWFQVMLSEEPTSPDPFLGVNIGEVSSVVSCDDSHATLNGDSRFPSFFRCGLDWLSKRSELQPQGCGLLPTKEKRHVETDDGHQNAERGGVQRAVQAFRRALLVSEWSYSSGSDTSSVAALDSAAFVSLGTSSVKSGRRNGDGVLAPATIDIIADAWDAWRTVSEFGLRVPSTSLRAVIEYNLTGKESSLMQLPSRDLEDKTQLLSVALRNVTIETLLEAPKLFDADEAQRRAPFIQAGGDDSPSIIEFEPTLVANVASLKIPLSNPTAVPVRVRLAIAPSEDDRSGSLDLGIDEIVRSRYVGSFGNPYVQDGRKPSASEPVVLANYHWWDGGGAFFMSDFYGDVIRSHHNMTIRAGAGAYMSLISPCLFANSAFTVGCASRCGLREDDTKKGLDKWQMDLRQTSPIGASAAVGEVLVGRRRRSAEDSSWMSPEQTLPAAGASLVAAGDGPTPFAIPYSSLDEVIIPPFGKADLGPILFRPPGRSKYLGCQPDYFGTKPPDFCKSNAFESLIFLENSLSGLERIVLRGKAQWERIIFYDHFGDIELRNGRSALVFPGGGEGSKASTKPIVKELIVQNDGDVPVTIVDYFLSGTAKLHDAARLQRSANPCQLGEFRMVGCRSDGPDSTPLGTPWHLLPGETRSIFIEHRPRCTQKKAFIALNLVHDRKYARNVSTRAGELSTAVLSSEKDSFSSSRSNRIRRDRASSWHKTFRKQKEEILIGFDMTSEDFSSCLPVANSYSRIVPASDPSVQRGTRLQSNETGWPAEGYLEEDQMLVRGGIGALSACGVLVVMVVSAAHLARSLHQRQQSTQRFRVMVEGKKIGSKEKISNERSDWRAAFRCLARSDPTSSDLQTLGREQIRHVVLARFRSVGILPPQCFNNAGVFNRERIGVLGNTGRQNAGNKVGSPNGNERIRTLSDAIFRRFAPWNDGFLGWLPCDLGWRTAAKRGIINTSSLNGSPVLQTSKKLLLNRSDHSCSVEESIQDDDQSIESSDDEEDSDASFGENSEDLSVEHDEKLKLEKVSSQEDGKPKLEKVSSQEDGKPKLEKVSSKEDEKLNLEKVSSQEEDKRTIDASGTTSTPSPAKSTPDKDKSAVLKAAPKTIVSQKESLTTREKAVDEPKEKSREIQVSTEKPDRKKTELIPAKKRSSPKKEAASGKADEVPDTLTHKAENGSNTRSKVSPSAKKSPAKSSLSKTETGRKETKDATPRRSRRKSKDKDSLGLETKRPAKEEKKKDEKKAARSDRGTKGKKSPSQKSSKSASKSGSTKSSRKKESEVTPPVSPSKQVSAILRPPPGLLPPPGFGSSNTSPLTQAFAVNAEGALSLPSSALPPSGVGASQLFPSSLPGSSPVRRPDNVVRGVSAASTGSGDQFLSNPNSPALGPIGGQDNVPSLGSLLNESQPENPDSGFDVMDFLDGILNDGSASGTYGEDTGLTAEAHQPTPAMGPVLANPWASDDGQKDRSRASAYGISFDQESERSSEQQTNVNIPLLTPAAILAQATGGEEEKEKVGSSFYANLLGE